MVKLADKQEPSEPQGRLAQSWRAFARVMLTDEEAPPRLGLLCEICFFAGAHVAMDYVVRGLAAGENGVIDELIAEATEAQARIKRELLELDDQDESRALEVHVDIDIAAAPARPRDVLHGALLRRYCSA